VVTGDGIRRCEGKLLTAEIAENSQSARRNPSVE
jgi:hypothetical protein